MKIAIMSDCYLPRLGGIEVQVRDLAFRLVRAGHEVEVFTATVGAQGERHGQIDVCDGITVHRMGVRLPGKLPMNPFAGKELRRRLVSGRFDVAHVHMGIVSPFTVDCTRIALDLRLPITMTWHCMLGMAEQFFSATKFVGWWAQQGVAMNAVSSLAARPVQRIVGDLGVVATLPNGIDAHTWWRNDTPTTPQLPPSYTEGVQVVSAMRLVGRKRPLAMVDVMEEVRRRLPDDVPLRVSIVGDGRMRPQVERKIKRDGVSGWVELPGRLSRPELLSRYRKAHVYLSPAKLESFGIAALEARCMGLPVVGLNTSGAAEFVRDGVNGYLCDDGMAEALTRLLTDHALREQMFRYNVTTPPEQDWRAVVDATLTEYARATELRDARPRR